MGAGQSTSSDRNGAGAGQEVKTSYYELLGVHRQATDDELKKAYRKKALELHPDRNYGNTEAATKTFAEVQAAYEILSDAQERAWYDSHEAAILRGDDAVGDGDAPTFDNVRVTTADDLARMVRKFNSNVDFSDAPSGFFGFVRETFEQLAREEEIAANWENTDVRDYPSFGHKDDEYDDVVKRFYSSWSSFSTVKTFSWKDKYRLSEAPDRWYRRRMEQENSRIRQDAKREFNDAVRSLIAFIRKRDPRYVPSTQSEADRQKTLKEAAAAQAARARAANEAKIQSTDVPEWTRIREPDELVESEAEESEQEVFECVACDKIFKSERQWEAHEKSKKHQKALRSLQQRMRKQNISLELDESNEQSRSASPGTKDEDESADEPGQDVDDKGIEKHTTYSLNDATNGLEHDIDEETYANASLSGDEKLQEKPKPQESEPEPDEEEGLDSEDEDYATLEVIQARMQSATFASAEDSDEDTKAPKPKMGKAAQKRAKKAAAAAATASEENNTGHKCEVCNALFPSKTKLFQHIKDEGHAALKSATSSGAKGKKGKGKR